MFKMYYSKFNYFCQLIAVFNLWLLSANAYASDSYRFFHVTIDTPWLIFIFLLMIILFPFVLSAILYWHFTFRKQKELKTKDQEENSVDSQVISEVSSDVSPEEK